MAKGTAWEYKVTQSHFHSPPIDLNKPKSQDAQKHLTEMGDAGWEMIHLIQQNMLFTFFWKREKKKSDTTWDS